MTGRLRPALAALAILAAAVAPVAAHEPDPLLGGKLWAQDQVVSYAWKTGQVPPAWAASAIDAAAADAGRSWASRAAQFVRAASAASTIAYGQPTGCSAAGIACFDRTGAPSSFKMWFRAHDYAFDWGKLRWCQGLEAIASGCFDVENIALDEFGHVEILHHHANYANGSDYLDAVVQTGSRAYPTAGWNVHAFGRCDVARLQLEYERVGAAALFSTCLSVTTTTTLGASATSIAIGGTVRFSAGLRVSSLAANRALASDPISGRSVLLQRRAVGASSWTTIATMTASSTTAGTYSTTISPTSTYEWRATFATPTTEGLVGSSSAVVKVTVSGCTGSGCPTAQTVRP